MCGITGFLKIGGFAAADAEQIIAAQTRALMHRGPDDVGTWIDSEVGIALGHRRLSILDLSPAGHQPMVSQSGRHLIVLNGEIYNHLELRAALVSSTPTLVWNGHSDTETLLNCLEVWGIERTLTSLVGMFAFAVWDRCARTLILARDRMGEKPLYYGWQNGTFLFGSELKALRAHPSFRAELERTVIADYLQHGYIRAPRSIYRDISKLAPGNYLQIAATKVATTPVSPKQYWCLRDTIERGRREPFRGGDADAVRLLDDLLGRAVALQSVADVPLGAFLSGGVDSSLVVATMQEQSSRPIRTFTIGFNEPRFNEAVYARAVAQHLGTDHTELYVSSDDATQVIPKLPGMFDEPFGDSSAIPTYLVSKLARSQVTVSLSGDGGDEVFGGYSRYQRTASLWRNVERVPRGVRAAVSNGMRALAPLSRAGALGGTLHRAGQFLSARDAQHCYQIQFSQYYGLPTGVLEDSGPAKHPQACENETPGSLLDHMMYEDSVAYLPDDILTKVDRAAMAVSLESRIPLLDHRLVQFAWSLPAHMKVREGRGKWLLRQALRRRVPDALIERKKMGFGVPVGEWMRGPLRDWAESLLSRERLMRQGVFDPNIVRDRWRQFLRGGRVGSDGIWSLVMFQAWLQE